MRRQLRVINCPIRKNTRKIREIQFLQNTRKITVILRPHFVEVIISKTKKLVKFIVIYLIPGNMIIKEFQNYMHRLKSSI